MKHGNDNARGHIKFENGCGGVWWWWRRRSRRYAIRTTNFDVLGAKNFLAHWDARCARRARAQLYNQFKMCVFLYNPKMYIAIIFICPYYVGGGGFVAKECLIEVSPSSITNLQFPQTTPIKSKKKENTLQNFRTDRQCQLRIICVRIRTKD